MLTQHGVLIVVSGFSGAGKGTVMKRLLEKYNNYALSISMTTRSPRIGEVDGKDYFFVTREVFEDTIAKDGLIEHACYCGNYYGSPRAYVEEKLDRGQDVILEIEIQGALEIKRKYPDTLLLFITPPSADELKKRLVGRNTETEEQIAARLKRAVDEAPSMNSYDYIVINDNVDECADEINALVDAAKHTGGRNQKFIETMQKELSHISGGEK